MGTKAIISVSDEAKQYLRDMMRKQDCRTVMFGLDGGGCAGFQYFWNPLTDDDANRNDIADEIDLDDGFTLAVHVGAMPFIIGSTVNYETDFSGSRLTVDNPLAKSACGCGTSVSFDLDSMQ